ncbi:uncharacterized protein LOC114277975 [Camellia sinensis]|uniref:Uncharacterized protein n=1 Tax=Camellia sinensis var. sinensis TaxID=542762 RepID=A0A4S4E7X3_CAMSN|nr:uncharacterized protein LOC114277975 [Camellia sinensis]THG11724.1 hypothetical protein TEA_003814 [Camellia sinensis var. sinensis]
MTSPSSSQPQEEPELQTQNPNSTQDDENQNRSQPQSPQTQTLETSDQPQNPEQSETDQTQNQQQQEEEDLQVVDQKGDQHHHQEPDDQHAEQSGMSSLSPPPPLIPLVTDLHDLNPPPLTSPTTNNPPRRPNKRKKGYKKKQQAIEKKLQTLTSNLKPIPFVPSKTLDFDKHEKLLKRLGLWDFVHIEFDRNIRVDLISQLIATYDSRLRCSYVNEFRIMVNRADLARAFKLPVKKDKGNASALLSSSSEAVDLDSEVLSDESVAFIEDFLSNWVLLHEDMWMMPSEVLNWTRAIKDGHPEKVDWAGLIWFMVEKELNQGQQLEDCYYASHLQYLMKSQREEVFCIEPKVEVEAGVEVEVEAEAGAEVEVEVEEVKEDEDDGGEVKMGASDEFQGHDESQDNNAMVEEPNVELTLGQDIVEKEEVLEGDMMDVEESKEEEQGQWLLDGKNSVGDHFLQRCNIEADTDMNGDEERQPEEEVVEEDEEDNEEEEEMEDEGFNLMSKGSTLEGNVLTGNLLQGMETTQIPFGLPEQLHDQSNMELLASRTEPRSTSGGLSIFGNGSKREIGHEHDISHETLNDNINNKRLRTDGQWSPKSSDFEMCMDQMQHWMGKARIMYQAKEQACDESNMNHQFLLSELQRREHVIEHLHKTKQEELHRKDGEIYRLERELYVMGNLLEGYRKALKETHKTFSEYRQQCQLPEEPLYKDAGPGGVVLSTMELEKQRLKQEEEDRLTRIIIEQKIKEFEEEFVSKLEESLNKVQRLDKQLMDFENEVKLLKELSAKRKVSNPSECASTE